MKSFVQNIERARMIAAVPEIPFALGEGTFTTNATEGEVICVVNDFPENQAQERLRGKVLYGLAGTLTVSEGNTHQCGPAAGQHDAVCVFPDFLEAAQPGTTYQLEVVEGPAREVNGREIRPKRIQWGVAVEAGKPAVKNAEEQMKKKDMAHQEKMAKLEMQIKEKEAALKEKMAKRDMDLKEKVEMEKLEIEKQRMEQELEQMKKIEEIKLNTEREKSKMKIKEAQAKPKPSSNNSQ